MTVRALPPLVVPGQVSSLGAIADYVSAAAREAELDQRAHYHLRLAVDEIATNVILHGYQEHGLQGDIELSARFDERMMTVVIEDTAPAFDPRPALAAGANREPLEERDVGGLGLLLVSRSADAFSYERTDGKNRNVVGIRRAARARAATGQAPEPGAAPAIAVAVLPEWRPHLEEAARGLGHVAWIHDIDELFAQLERRIPDLLLLGLEVPSLPAALAADACLHRLRVRYQDTLPPVVLLFEAGSEERLAACLDERVFDILAMRLPAILIRARLVRVLERARLAAELRAVQKRLAELETLRHDFTGIILPLGALLSKEPDLARLMERIVSEAMSICRADGGTLYLEAGDELRFSIMRTDSLGMALGGASAMPVPYAPLPLHDPGTGMPNHRNAAASAANARRSINVPDVYDARAGFDFSGAQEFDRKLGYRTVSCLTVPLVAGGDLFGVLQMINARDAAGAVIPFGAYHQQVIESLASQAAIALQNHFLLHERESQLEFERELAIGREIQSSFLPAKLPRIPGWQLATHMQPARLVSGDFYDGFELAPGCFGLIVADVCDKGVGAALFMGLIRSLLRAFAQTSWRRDTNEATARRRALRQARRTQGERIDWLTRTLQRSVLLTNDYIANTHGELGMFATLFFGVLEAESGVLLYTNGGHPPVLIVGASGVRAQLGPTGPALGVIAGAEFRVEQAVIAPGELCFGYTDGVVDMRDRAGERFGSERLQRLLAATPGSAQEVIDGLREALRRHSHGAEMFDDVSMLSVRRTG